MRIRRLVITGFGPFKDRQEVDFGAFEADGLFLITGRTGAGKSSILDAMCFALYGSIPRFEGTQQKLRSDHCDTDDPTSVELEFTVDGTDYLVTRSPEYERPKARGAGTTLHRPTATLAERVGDTWVGIAARPVDVAPEISRIVGLTREQFLQVILLAQNRFQDFLVAKNDDRQKVLRSLFGTHRFLDIETALVDRRKELDARLGDVRQAIEQDAALTRVLGGDGADSELAAWGSGGGGPRSAAPDSTRPDLAGPPTAQWFGEVLSHLTSQRDSSVVQAARADADATAADEAHRALESLRVLQVRRATAIATAAELEERRPSIDDRRETVAASRRAAAVMPHLTTARASHVALDVALTAEALAREVFAAATDTRLSLVPNPDSAAEAAELDVLIDETASQLGALRSVLADEATLPERSAAIDSQRSLVGDLSEATQDLATRESELPRTIGVLGDRLSALRIRSAADDHASERVDRIAAARESALLAVELEPNRMMALTAEAAASGVAAVAARRIHTLMEQRLAGFAGELAVELRDGEPCTVCGSTKHPLPAPRSATVVTDKDIDVARTAEDDARGALQTARAVAADLTERLTTARAAAGDTVESLEASLDGARALLADAQAAESEAAVVSAELDAVRIDLAGVTGRLAEARTAHDDAATLLATLLSDRAAVVSRVEASRGEFADVTTRCIALERLNAAAHALATAMACGLTRAESADAARRNLWTQLCAEGFAGRLEGAGLVDPEALPDASAAADAALLDSVTLTATVEAVRAFDSAADVVAATLADPEIAGALDDAVDLASSRAALDAARAERDRALSSRDSLEDRGTRLGVVVESAVLRLATSAALMEEHRLVRELSSAVEGNEPNGKRMRLETYVLAARLEEIVAAANGRLRTMTGWRYTLEHDDSRQYQGARSGLGLVVRDEHSGRARATRSLSGGEMFLASLALALGLAEVVTNQAGGIRLDTLFIDEGFGSLDSDTLEVAMSTLDSLRSGGRTIGLISHVDAMKEQIDQKLRITVSSQGHSRIEESFSMV
ncbi:MAG: SMC family ATPase [Burkholderiaceae bacterium]|nr:SMC family ATPase [Microbacteriaceae bacterium]